MERADNVARFIDVNLANDARSAQRLAGTVAAVGEHLRRRCRVLVELFAVATRDNVIKFLAFASENPNSIVSCLRAARENARTIRESISPEMWEQVNSCYLMVNAAATNQRLFASPYELF